MEIRVRCGDPVTQPFSTNTLGVTENSGTNTPGSNASGRISETMSTTREISAARACLTSRPNSRSWKWKGYAPGYARNWTGTPRCLRPSSSRASWHYGDPCRAGPGRGTRPATGRCHRDGTGRRRRRGHGGRRARSSLHLPVPCRVCDDVDVDAAPERHPVLHLPRQGGGVRVEPGGVRVGHPVHGDGVVAGDALPWAERV